MTEAGADGPRPPRAPASWSAYAGGDPALLAEPWPVFAELRARGPVVVDPDRDIWLLTDHATVVHALRHPALFSNAQGVGLVPSAGGRALANLDPPEHTARRRAVASRFGPRPLARHAPTLATWADEHLGRIDDGADVDVVAASYIGLAFCLVTGLPAVDAAGVVSFAAAASRLNGGAPRPGDPAECQAFVAHAARRLTEPTTGHGVLARLDPAAGADDQLDAVHHLASLAIGGCETPRHLLAAAIAALAADPGAWAQLRSGAVTVDAALDELLRHVSPIAATFRTVAADVPVGASTIPAGARALLLLGSANHDPTTHDRPDELVIDRYATGDAPPHCAFGHGPHHCIGDAVARLVIGTFLGRAVARWAAVAPRGRPAWEPGFLTRAVGRVRVAPDPTS